MLGETTKDQIVLNQIIGEKKESRIVENDVIVNDIKPDVLDIISTNGVVSIYKKEILDGRIRIDGVINTYVIYRADDENGSIRSLNSSLDFTNIIDMENARNGMELRVSVEIKSLDTKIVNGRKINIKANIETSIIVYSNESIDIITGVQDIPDIQMQNSTENINSLVGNGTNRITVRDTIAIDSADNLAEIMKVSFKIVDEEIKISYNKVLSKADAIVEIMYMTEDNRVNAVKTQIPIMGFVDIQNVNESCECEVQNSLANLIIKPNSTEEHSIFVEAEIEIICSAYESKEINIINDMYSIEKEIQFNKKSINAVTQRNKLTDIYTVKENIRIPELKGKVLDIQVLPVISNMQIRKGKVIYEGNLALGIMFEQDDGIITRNIDLPFKFDLNSDKISEKSLIETIMKIKRNDFIVNNGIVEVTIDICFELLEQKNSILNLIEDLQVEDTRSCNSYSMVIYFVKPGDTLWKIAKMFKSTVEDIARINDIKDVDKLEVGKQLYIPRFCIKKIAV